MPFGLLKFGLSKTYQVRRILPRQHDLKSHYDVVIIGAGGHGLAAAYYLATRHGITDIAVLDKGYLGGGNTNKIDFQLPVNVKIVPNVAGLLGGIALWKQ